MSTQGHRLYDDAALRQKKIEKLRLDGLNQMSPRMSGTGSRSTRGEVPDGWLVGSRSNGGWSRSGSGGGTLSPGSFASRRMPWEKQPAIEDHTRVREGGEEQEYRKAAETTNNFDYQAMLESAREQVRSTPRSRSAGTGVESPPVCRARDPKQFNRSKNLAFGGGQSPRFPTPKQNGMSPEKLPGPADIIQPDGLRRIDGENWRGHMSKSSRPGNASPWSASRSPKAATLDYAVGYKDNCTTLVVTNFGGKHVTSNNVALDVREELRSGFSRFGRVRAVRVAKNWESALVEYDLHEDARTACKCMNDESGDYTLPWATAMKVEYYKPTLKWDRPMRAL